MNNQIDGANKMKFVSRGAGKLLNIEKNGGFKIGENGINVCADFGSSTGGFVDYNLTAGAKKVYAVETGYGLLDWKLRNDPRVVVMERTNAMTVQLPEQVDLITIDTSWTKQVQIIPNAIKNTRKGGYIVSLIKPQYELGPKYIKNGMVNDKIAGETAESVKNELVDKFGDKIKFIHMSESPIRGQNAKNQEFVIIFKKIA